MNIGRDKATLEPLAPAWNEVLQRLRDGWPPRRWCGCGVVIGCSGGADSVALAVALDQLRRESQSAAPHRGFLKLVHVNHHLRGEESDADEALVRALAEELELPFEAARLEGDVDDEAALRSARQAVFLRVAHAAGARYVAVGHTADDNAETLLHQLFRGTGPAGLAAIPPHRSLGPDVVMIRPLLEVRRRTLREALRERQIRWRDDSSNSDSRYARNWIRHELLPQIESRYTGATERIAATATAVRGWRRLVAKDASAWLEQHRLEGGAVVLVRGSDAEPSVVIEALQQLWREQHWPRSAMTAAHWRRLAETLQAGAPTRFTLPGPIDVRATTTRVEIG